MLWIEFQLFSHSSSMMRLPKAVDIKTSTNSAYDIIDQGEGEYELVGMSSMTLRPCIERIYDIPALSPSRPPLPTTLPPVPIPTVGDVGVAREEERVYANIMKDQ